MHERTSHSPERTAALKHQRTHGNFDSDFLSASAGTLANRTPSPSILPAQQFNQLQSPARQDSGYDPRDEMCSTASDQSYPVPRHDS